MNWWLFRTKSTKPSFGVLDAHAHFFLNLLVQHLVTCKHMVARMLADKREGWGDHPLLLGLCCEIHLSWEYSSISLDILSVMVVKKVMTAAEDRIIFFVWIWFKNLKRNFMIYYTCLFSETWSCSEQLRILSNVLSSVLAAFIYDTLVELEGFMLLECSNTLFFSCQLRSV